MRRIFAILGVGGALLFTAAPAFAHDCFNPNKPDGAGVNYTIIGFDDSGAPIFQQTGPGQGIGGFVSLSPDLTDGVQAPDVHTIGNSSSHEVVGGPGSQKGDHACDGKGIDYLDACFGG
jgi:hypothetical protein